MHKLKDMQKEYERKGFHLQRLYKRRRADRNGIMRSTLGSIMEPSQGSLFSSVNRGVTIESLTKDVRNLQELVGNQSDSDPTNDEEIILIGGNAPIGEDQQ